MMERIDFIISGKKLPTLVHNMNICVGTPINKMHSTNTFCIMLEAHYRRATA